MASKIPFESETSAETPTLEKESSGKGDDVTSDYSLSSRDNIRAELNDQVAAYLAGGGQINQVQPHVTADPPKKPGSSYGSRPI